MSALAFLLCHGASRDGDLTGFGGLADVRQNALVRLLRWPWHTADGGRMAGSHRGLFRGPHIHQEGATQCLEDQVTTVS